MKFITKAAVIRLTILFSAIFILLIVFHLYVLHMPGISFKGSVAPPTPSEEQLGKVLHKHVEELATTIGARNVLNNAKLAKAADYIEQVLLNSAYKVSRISYKENNIEFHNIEVEIPGAKTPNEIVVIGAHYDSLSAAPGANDNASGVAAVLALAQAAKYKKFDKTVRFVAFANEEVPHFQAITMGSLVYSRYCYDKHEKIVAMLSLETIGCYTNAPNSQKYPFPFGLLYPTTGNFVGFVGNIKSRALVKTAIKSFRRHTEFPSEGAALPALVPGVSWSDHWSFWQAGYPAIMVTDTAPFRYQYYHTSEDTPDKLNYESMAKVVAGIERVVDEIAGGEPNSPPTKTEKSNLMAANKHGEAMILTHN